MIIFLILLYVAVANGIIIPTGCFIAAWVLTMVKQKLSSRKLWAAIAGCCGILKL